MSRCTKFIKAETIWDFLRVRTVRNECRRFLTNDTSNISVLRQVRFWIDLKNKENIEVYYVEVDGEVIGYGLIKVDGKKKWITGGVKAAYRGVGLGRELFQRLVYFSLPYEVWLEVMDWNVNALALYRSLGFRKTGMRGEHVIIMKRRKTK